ncbi:MAG: RnfABCDGE type electron transport complex subunit A [Candidatus Omnitrophica bacterium]|jgi:electron transport complex protein RnfA|nr:RnfABCDGE type electron transport complex subunit A [Candidatus Omnitrophota bacterium]MDD3274757.1 RnfABCDGE type electron transport complex subunit A [Candidatus Omnitrophota bacterium]MDD5078266.1 RnfABCDGE type electron transport complex subunit A [Candidatus Omnitrophota bacterium]
MNLQEFLSIFISSVFIYNVILSRFLGLCPFVAISKETKPALAMSAAVTFVITASSAVTWLIYRFLLLPFNLAYLRTLSFVLVIAALVQLIEMVIRKTSPVLYRAFGIYLTLITTNCAVLGAAVLNIDMFFVKGRPVAGSFYYSIFQGFCMGLGYTLAMLIMSGIRERLELSRVPKALHNFPIAFIIASVLSLSFMGFNGFKF